jgi:putative membrane protein
MKCSFARRLVSLSTVCLMVAVAGSALAQAVSDDDKKFVDAALKGGMGEVELGHLAVDKGASPDVKEFGQKMVTDHTRLGNKMKTVATGIGVTPPSGASVEAMATKAKLELLSGKTFDDEYIKSMVKAHEDDLQAFRNEAASGASPAVKRAAKEGATIVQEHLAMIRKIAAAHNVSVSMNSSKPSPYGSDYRGR